MVFGKKSILLLILFFISTSALFTQEIFDAVKSSDLNGINTILEKNKEVLSEKDIYGRTALHWAARASDPDKARDLIDILLSAGADVDSKDNNDVTALHSVAYRGFIKAAKLLISKGADFNLIDDTGNSPLSYALSQGQIEMVDLLIECGVDIKTNTEIAGNMLHSAASGGFKNLAKLMINRGVDLSFKNNSGGNILHSLALGNLSDLIKIIKEKGININETDRYGLTPLHYGVYKGSKEFVIELAENGADLNIKNIAGRSALNIAMETGNREIAEYLINKKANNTETIYTDLKGEYCGQKKPGLNPELFVPGIISTTFMEHSPVELSPNGEEIFWSSDLREFNGWGIIFYMKLENDRWTSPKKAPFFTDYINYNPVFSYDGRKIYFTSVGRFDENDEKILNVYSVERNLSGWSEPQKINIPGISGYLMTQISVTKDETIYLSFDSDDGKGNWDVFRSELIDGKYTEPENLGDAINTEYFDSYPFISRDENYLIFTSRDRPDGFGGMDLYISFKNEDGSWTKAKNMGSHINSNRTDAVASVTPDGKYIFFVSDKNGNADMYWVGSRIIDLLR